MSATQGIIAQAAALCRARSQEGMTPQEIAVEDARVAAEREARQAGEAEREARNRAAVAEERRQAWLARPRYGIPGGTGRPARLMGRLSNGGEADGGRVAHIVPSAQAHDYGSGPAICGRKPGGRSGGWEVSDRAATCPRCLAKATLTTPAGEP